jgi:hypothetical protein
MNDLEDDYEYSDNGDSDGDAYLVDGEDDTNYQEDDDDDDGGKMEWRSSTSNSNENPNAAPMSTIRGKLVYEYDFSVVCFLGVSF